MVTCESRECADWLASLFSTTNFWGRAQETVVRAFGLGTGAFAVWMDVGRRLVRVRHYDARMVVPLSWDAEGVRECAFVTRCFSRGALLDQLQMHVVGDDGAYRIRTVCFDRDGRVMGVPGIAEEVGTGSVGPTFGIVRPAVPNTRVDFSPYGQSVFADAVDAVQSVDLAYDALINEVDAGKMRVFLSDVMFDQERTADGRRVPIPFGKGDCTVFRKVMSTEDTIQEFAPALRTEAQGKAFRLALQVLGDLCGLGTNYFDLDNVGYVKTATEVSSDNSALMRNIRKNENALAGALGDVARMARSRRQIKTYMLRRRKRGYSSLETSESGCELGSCGESFQTGHYRVQHRVLRLLLLQLVLKRLDQLLRLSALLLGNFRDG